MNDWYENTYFFNNFSLELANLWVLNGFNEEAIKAWLEAGLNPKDYDFAEWLVKGMNLTPKDFIDYNYDYTNMKSFWKNWEKKSDLDFLWITDVETQDGSKISIFNQEKAIKRAEAFKALDRGKKIKTKIIAMETMCWGTLKFTTDDYFRGWLGEEGLIDFFTDNILPYNTWKVGDRIEIDIERLNSEKCYMESLGQFDKEIIVKLSKKEEIVNSKFKKRIEELEQRLTLEKELRQKLIEDYKAAQKEHNEYVKQINEQLDQIEQNILLSVFF